jgi:hypothetical protein
MTTFFERLSRDWKLSFLPHNLTNMTATKKESSRALENEANVKHRMLPQDFEVIQSYNELTSHIYKKHHRNCSRLTRKKGLVSRETQRTTSKSTIMPPPISRFCKVQDFKRMWNLNSDHSHGEKPRRTALRRSASLPVSFTDIILKESKPLFWFLPTQASTSLLFQDTNHTPEPNECYKASKARSLISARLYALALPPRAVKISGRNDFSSLACSAENNRCRNPGSIIHHDGDLFCYSSDDESECSSVGTTFLD